MTVLAYPFMRHKVTAEKLETCQRCGHEFYVSERCDRCGEPPCECACRPDDRGEAA